MIDATHKQKALTVFQSFETLMQPFTKAFPSGSISWNTDGLLSEVSFEGEFQNRSEDYIRFTEEIKRREEAE